MSPHAPLCSPNRTLVRVFPSRPTTCPTCSSSEAIRSLAATISLNVSAILPSSPVWSLGRRTEKSPIRMACNACSNSCMPNPWPLRWPLVPPLMRALSIADESWPPPGQHSHGCIAADGTVVVQVHGVAPEGMSIAATPRPDRPRQARRIQCTSARLSEICSSTVREQTAAKPVCPPLVLSGGRLNCAQRRPPPSRNNQTRSAKFSIVRLCLTTTLFFKLKIAKVMERSGRSGSPTVDPNFGNRPAGRSTGRTATRPRCASTNEAFQFVLRPGNHLLVRLPRVDPGQH